MTLVLDASVFFTEIPFDGPASTTPSVVAELTDTHAKCRFEVLTAAGLRVREPREEDLARVDAAALRTGDSGVLSGTDRDILALALELSAVLVTDDFAVQNVAHRLGIETRSIRQRPARPIRWRYRCSGCGRYWKGPGDCPICGASIKRKLK
ncbi:MULTISPECIES: NOB1 family endonuclease [Methanoculleus]|uniref:Nucleic acid-binding protein, containing PIN domain and zinc-ribbon module n=2 Tax=Methanoculleus TaxID=45989 RepID=A3CS57_METMJ|nr:MULTISPECIES: nucleotide-binding protein [Methanoculleus]ABN56207.1 nucleic acid-binding protein, containing PIN domain and zinc-ribbon module [Methanoculleus marisnigri JR1]MCC7556499.1 nucleotide-binding protein [Methanoculleus marisnigri]UYU17676.1 nucleotide-binding protein [Methanoculleus submarinus]